MFQIKGRKNLTYLLNIVSSGLQCFTSFLTWTWGSPCPIQGTKLRCWNRPITVHPFPYELCGHIDRGPGAGARPEVRRHGLSQLTFSSVKNRKRASGHRPEVFLRCAAEGRGQIRLSTILKMVTSSTSRSNRAKPVLSATVLTLEIWAKGMVTRERTVSMGASFLAAAASR